ncbi:polysaccharide biosynthesis tyrosine autokinase [Aliidiomarina celeris]|uniref:polysaccharide biosynthesis tyrosine autokinase n=1 Tax=Aliidiomarina celeris TaxID=2249428 RepID=UPI000DEBCEE0|nr:polysaccharide biosynthesis tyrosine autokinase [Aliidiomarina celeris]
MTELNKPTRTAKESSANDEIDLGRLIATLFDFKWWIVGCTFAAGVFGASYAILTNPVYQADALLQVEEKTSGLAGLGDIGEMFSQESSAVTEIEIMRSRMVVGTVAEQLRLDIQVTPKRFPIIGNWVARRHPAEEGPNAASVFTSYAWGGETLEVSELRLPRALMGKPLTLRALEPTGEQQRFTLLHEGTEVLSGVSGQTIEQNTPFGEVLIRVAEFEARPRTEFSLQQQPLLRVINGLQREIGVSERGRQSGILSATLSGENPQRIQRILHAVTQEYLLQNIRRNAAEAEKSLEFLQEQLPEVRGDLQRAEDLLNAYRLESESVDIQLETQGLLQQIVELEKQINELAFREAELSRLYTRNHPTYKALIEQQDKLRDDRDELRRQIQNLPETQQEVLRLTRDVQVNQEIYVQLLNQVQELNILRAGTVGNVRIIDEAMVRLEPIAPRKALILVLAVMLGGMVGVGIAFVLGFIRRGIETPKELEDAGISVYASVPLSEQQLKIEERIKQAVRRSKNKAQKQKFNTLLLARDNPEDNAVEALRALRTSLHFAMLEAKNKVVMISGPSPEVGKTFISSNLAVVLAQAGMKVLMIDADLRRGYLHTTFNLSNENGLSDLLSGRSTREQSLQSTGVPNLDFIARGTVPPNPSELLMHKSFSELLEWANETYDIVLVDTPPILAVTDPAIVGRYAGTNLIVARFMKNQVKEVEYTIERFEKAGIEIKGVILNGIEKTARSSYGYGSYGYYSYGYESSK